MYTESIVVTSMTPDCAPKRSRAIIRLSCAAFTSRTLRHTAFKFTRHGIHVHARTNDSRYSRAKCTCRLKFSTKGAREHSLAFTIALERRVYFEKKSARLSGVHYIRTTLSLSLASNDHEGETRVPRGRRAVRTITRSICGKEMCFYAYDDSRLTSFLGTLEFDVAFG